MTFDACRAPRFLAKLSGGHDIVVSRCETHVCVLQTVLGHRGTWIGPYWCWRGRWVWGGRGHLPIWTPAMPFKANAAGRDRIPRQRQQVTNWTEYDAALRQRGSLTVWVTDEAIAAWRAEPRTTRGGQPRYSLLAITTALTLRMLFRLGLRQTEGLIGSIFHLLGVDVVGPNIRVTTCKVAGVGKPGGLVPIGL